MGPFLCGDEIDWAGMVFHSKKGISRCCRPFCVSTLTTTTVSNVCCLESMPASIEGASSEPASTRFTNTRIQLHPYRDDHERKRIQRQPGQGTLRRVYFSAGWQPQGLRRALRPAPHPSPTQDHTSRGLRHR